MRKNSNETALKSAIEAAEEYEMKQIFNFERDPESTSRYLEKGLPPLLAMVLPANLEVTEVGDCGDGPMYIVRKIYASGTVTDIIEQLAEKQKANEK